MSYVKQLIILLNVLCTVYSHGNLLNEYTTDNYTIPAVTRLNNLTRFDDVYVNYAGLKQLSQLTVNISTVGNMSYGLYNIQSMKSNTTKFVKAEVGKYARNEHNYTPNAIHVASMSNNESTTTIVTRELNNIANMARLSEIISNDTKVARRSDSVSMSLSVTKQSDIASKMSVILNDLLHNYDKTLRPNLGGQPVTVLTDINLRSMGPISEKQMQFSIDCYLRQKWQDPRLALNISLAWVPLSIQMLERIWHPDTVFHNGRHSYHHLITTPNKFLRIESDGTLLYSQRLTVLASCPMNLKSFPMDTQECPLIVGSFGYSTNEVTYRWRFGDNKSVDISPTVTLSQFELVDYPSKQTTAYVKGSPHSLLHIHFRLRRRMGYFMIQVYFPCCLLVVLSWVSFWINREATADRIALGVMTVLTMTFFALDCRRDLPRVSHPTALDLYVSACFIFVLCVILQFACVHKFTKLGSGEMFPVPVVGENQSDDSNVSSESDYESSECEQETDECEQEAAALGQETVEYDRETYKRKRKWSLGATSLSPVKRHAGPMRCSDVISSDPDLQQSPTMKAPTRPKLRRKESRYRRFIGSLMGSFRSKDHDAGLNSVSQLDSVSRLLFPVIFALFNLFYWSIYYG